MERMLEATARAEERHFWFLALRRNARTFLETAVGGRRDLNLVDCGAGTGRNLDWLRGFGRVAGIELHPAGLAEGRRRHRPMIRASVARLPFADATVDVTTSFDVLYCLDDAAERDAIAEMFRVLKPGGVLLVNAAALDALRGAHSTLTQEVRRYTPARLRARLERAGFRVERLTFTGLVLFPIALAVRTFDRSSGRAGAPSEADLQVPARPINRLLDLALRIEGAWLRRGRLPIGTSLLCVARKPAPTAGLRRR